MVFIGILEAEIGHLLGNEQRYCYEFLAVSSILNGKRVEKSRIL